MKRFYNAITKQELTEYRLARAICLCIETCLAYDSGMKRAMFDYLEYNMVRNVRDEHDNRLQELNEIRSDNEKVYRLQHKHERRRAKELKEQTGQAMVMVMVLIALIALAIIACGQYIVRFNLIPACVPFC